MLYGLGQTATPIAPNNAALSAMWGNVARYAIAQAGSKSPLAGLRALADNTNVRAMAMQWMALPAPLHAAGLMAIAAYASTISSAYARPVRTLTSARRTR